MREGFNPCPPSFGKFVSVNPFSGDWSRPKAREWKVNSQAFMTFDGKKSEAGLTTSGAPNDTNYAQS